MMAQPAADYKILKDNRSSYNLIAHDHHVPRSPLFGPSFRHAQGDPRREYETYGDSSTEKPHAGGDRPRGEVWTNVQESQTYGKEDPEQQFSGDYHPSNEMIRHERHVPASPLYKPNQGHGLAQTDPRYGSADGTRRAPAFGRNFEIPRPKDPPTPDFNTTQLHIPDNEDDTKLQLGGFRGSQEDLRDYKANKASWAGYHDQPVNRGPPYTDRPGYGGDKSYRENPWSSRANMSTDVVDPRVGGHHDGVGLVGNRNGGALLFIRFPIGHGENIQVAAQAFLKSKTHDNGGRFMGMAKKVYDFGYEKGPVEAVGVFHFPTIDKALLFFQMDPIIRQPDFPPPYGHAEMWVICNAYLPDNLQLFNTFLLSEVELHSGKEKREFFETFQKPFESYLYKNGAMPFVICSYGAFDRKSLRRHNYQPTSIVTCHLFQGLDHLNWITSDETYSKFRSLHNQMATEKCCIFTLSRDMFP